MRYIHARAQVLSPLRLMASGQGSQKSTAYEYKSMSMGPAFTKNVYLGGYPVPPPPPAPPADCCEVYPLGVCSHCTQYSCNNVSPPPLVPPPRLPVVTSSDSSLPYLAAASLSPPSPSPFATPPPPLSLTPAPLEFGDRATPRTLPDVTFPLTHRSRTHVAHTCKPPPSLHVCPARCCAVLRALLRQHPAAPSEPEPAALSATDAAAVTAA